MKIGETYIVEISDIIEDSENNKYAKMKGFNTLIFDKEGLKRLKKTTSIDDAWKEGLKEGYRLARRIAFAPASELREIGFDLTFVDNNYDDFSDKDEYEISCDIINMYDVEQVAELFKEFDRINDQNALDDMSSEEAANTLSSTNIVDNARYNRALKKAVEALRQISKENKYGDDVEIRMNRRRYFGD